MRELIVFLEHYYRDFKPGADSKEKKRQVPYDFLNSDDPVYPKMFSDLPREQEIKEKKGTRIIRPFSDLFIFRFGKMMDDYHHLMKVELAIGDKKVVFSDSQQNKFENIAKLFLFETFLQLLDENKKLNKEILEIIMKKKNIAITKGTTLIPFFQAYLQVLLYAAIEFWRNKFPNEKEAGNAWLIGKALQNLLDTPFLTKQLENFDSYSALLAELTLDQLQLFVKEDLLKKLEKSEITDADIVFATNKIEFWKKQADLLLTQNFVQHSNAINKVISNLELLTSSEERFLHTDRNKHVLLHEKLNKRDNNFAILLLNHVQKTQYPDLEDKWKLFLKAFLLEGGAQYKRSFDMKVFFANDDREIKAE